MKLHLWSIVFALTFTSVATRAQTVVTAPLPPAEIPSAPRVFIAGDSTAAKGAGEEQQGWGERLGELLDPGEITVINRARGGRSSRTFVSEGRWSELLTEIKRGDFVLIQFGHNDGGAINEEPPGSTRPLRARGSLPGTGEETQSIDNVVTKQPEVVHSFGWYMRKMIAEAKAKGATPIVLSLTVRNIWTDGAVERGSGNYRTWSRDVARETGVPFVDVTRIIADAYQALGEAQVKRFFTKDHTHTNAAGAEFNAAAVVAGLQGIRQGPWTKFLSAKGRAVRTDTIGWLNLPEPTNADLPSVVLIGDSTVRNGGGDGAGGEWGWGEPLAELFDAEKINVVNRAIGGLSSRTFLMAGHWARALTLMKRGDFLLMQFGHNDNGPLNDLSRARGTIKGVGDEAQEVENLLTGQHEEVRTYGWYLRKYIRDAKERGIVPIVCSPVPRKTWKEGRIVRSADSYGGWAKQVADEEGARFIDLNDRVATRYEQLGEEAVDILFADAHTHTSRAGAELNAAIIAEAVREMPEIPLAKFLR